MPPDISQPQQRFKVFRRTKDDAAGGYTLSWHTSGLRALSPSEISFSYPAALPTPGDLFVHQDTSGSGTVQVWVWTASPGTEGGGTWIDAEEGSAHPTIPKRVLWFVNGSKLEPSWVQMHTYVTYRSKARRADCGRGT